MIFVGFASFICLSMRLLWDQLFHIFVLELVST